MIDILVFMVKGNVTCSTFPKDIENPTIEASIAFKELVSQSIATTPFSSTNSHHFLIDFFL